jgi:mRNA interferase RelE/StbE
MAWEVQYTQEAIDDLRRLDHAVAQRVLRRLRWIEGNFDSVRPEALSGSLRGLFKLRVGSYRVVYSYNSTAHTLTVHLVGHRSSIYQE